MNPKALDHFLASVEHRAFRIAALATRNDEQALELVQEAMMRLAEKYADRPEAEWPLLFQRILQNAILDHHRRQKVRRAWVSQPAGPRMSAAKRQTKPSTPPTARKTGRTGWQTSTEINDV